MEDKRSEESRRAVGELLKHFFDGAKAKDGHTSEEQERLSKASPPFLRWYAEQNKEDIAKLRARGGEEREREGACE